ncbi:unnamed protein product [Phytomonas sp. EM1]|nr:unnamed protein product [Phytomonas sp. EM1]|eukprot:CCW60885.1 unnamed protein product [Phytomonas sp. isolate EM1]
MPKWVSHLSSGCLWFRSNSSVKLPSFRPHHALLFRRHLSLHPCSTASPFLRISTRDVQYVHSSETLSGINKRKRNLNTKWVTKSTKEYMQEVDGKVHSASSILTTRWDKQNDVSAQRKAQLKKIREESARAFQNELDRIDEDNSRRWRKGYNFFKRQGWPFVILYLSAYFVTWFALYIGFATGFLKKEAAFDYMFLLIGSYVSRDLFYQRIEAWDSYVNVGFAFVINEMLEIFRFTLVLAMFLEFRRFFTGAKKNIKPSIFRMGAAES